MTTVPNIVAALIATSLLVAFLWVALSPAVAFSAGVLLSLWVSKTIFS